MYIALDENHKRITIENAKKGNKYYCTECKAEVITKKGKVREHHFAHKNEQTSCSYKKHEGKTLWHREWQNLFGADYQEIILENNDEKRIADVSIHNYVIEFQHSPMKLSEFRSRNKFYTSLGYKIIWVFDLLDAYENGQIYTINENNTYEWIYQREPLKSINLPNENCTIYFQLEDNGICKILDAKESFKNFSAAPLITKEDFVKGVINQEADILYTPIKKEVIKSKPKNEIRNLKSQNISKKTSSELNSYLDNPIANNETQEKAIEIQNPYYSLQGDNTDPTIIIKHKDSKLFHTVAYQNDDDKFIYNIHDHQYYFYSNNDLYNYDIKTGNIEKIKIDRYIKFLFERYIWHEIPKSINNK